MTIISEALIASRSNAEEVLDVRAVGVARSNNSIGAYMALGGCVTEGAP